MATKIKGIYKSFKFISQIFVVKDREMEIGYPTDVKHVAHIGWDHSPSITAPSWMNEFRTSTKLATPFGSTGETRVTTWSNQDPDDTIRSKTTSIQGSSSDNHNKASKRNKSRKTKSTSSPKSSSSSSSSSTRRSRAPKSKLPFSEATPTIQV